MRKFAFQKTPKPEYTVKVKWCNPKKKTKRKQKTFSDLWLAREYKQTRKRGTDVSDTGISTKHYFSVHQMFKTERNTKKNNILIWVICMFCLERKQNVKNKNQWRAGTNPPNDLLMRLDCSVGNKIILPYHHHHQPKKTRQRSEQSFYDSPML